MEFVAFPKIPRMSRNVVVTEKIDGTNAQIVIGQWRDYDEEFVIKHNLIDDQHIDETDYCMFAGSRNRFITPENDNAGFAKWCASNWQELIKLGIGQHFGEWWGKGIQRGYGLSEKRFSLFNAGRWTDDVRPACCHVVPILLQHTWDNAKIDEVMAKLKSEGSVAAPGYMDPEGVVVLHTQSRQMYKKTFKFDETGKEAA